MNPYQKIEVATADIRSKGIKLGKLQSILLDEIKLYKRAYEGVVYCLIDETKVLYVGCTTNLKQRWITHPVRSKLNTAKSYMIVYIPCLFEERYFVEGCYIYRLQPEWNVAGKK
jgi:hypothetical protein